MIFKIKSKKNLACDYPIIHGNICMKKFKIIIKN